jgi:hypothetical protein
MSDVHSGVLKENPHCHLMHPTSHIVECGIKCQYNWPPCYTCTLYLTHCWKWCYIALWRWTALALIYNVVGRQRNRGLHGDQYYWCLMPLSTICQLEYITWWPVLLVFWPPCYTCTLYLTHCWKWCWTPIKLVTMLYILTDILLKVALNTNNTGHHVVRDSSVVKS